MNNSLTLEQISRMPLEQIVDAYTRGCRLTGKDDKLVAYLQATCPAGPLKVGDSTTMTLIGSGGTAPYTHRFQKNGIDLSNGVFTGVGEGVSKTYIYIITSTDVSPTRLSGTVTDSCETPQSCSKYCDITIAVPTTVPPTTVPPTTVPPTTVPPTTVPPTTIPPTTIPPTTIPPTTVPPTTIPPTTIPPTIRYSCVPIVPGSIYKTCTIDPTGPYTSLTECMNECPLIPPTTVPPCAPVNCNFIVVKL